MHYTRAACRDAVGVPQADAGDSRAPPGAFLLFVCLLGGVPCRQFIDSCENVFSFFGAVRLAGRALDQIFQPIQHLAEGRDVRRTPCGWSRRGSACTAFRNFLRRVCLLV